MKKKIFLIPHCSTCQGHLKGKPVQEHTFCNIKEKNISEEELDWLAKQTGSYNALFSRNARKYRALQLKDKNLSETDIKKLILEEYTFLKRPVIVWDEMIEVAGKTYDIKN